MKKIMILLMMVGLISPLTAGQTVKIYPSHDSYIDEYYPNNNFNMESLRAGYLDYLNSIKGKQRSFLKFDLSTIPGTVTDAKFSIDPAGGPVGTPNLQLYYVADDSWSENTLTWNNAPTYSTLIDSKSVNSGERINFDINSVINEQDGILSLAIKSQQETTNIYIQFFSGEFEAGGSENEDELYWPYLEVTYGDSECPTPDYSNVCCTLTPIQMMGFINKFNNFETSYTPLEMMNFINKFNQFQSLC